jgi:hypothetical protein
MLTACRWLHLPAPPPPRSPLDVYNGGRLGVSGSEETTQITYDTTKSCLDAYLSIDVTTHPTEDPASPCPRARAGCESSLSITYLSFRRWADDNCHTTDTSEAPCPLAHVQTVDALRNHSRHASLPRDIAVSPFCSALGSSADALSWHTTDAANLEQETVNDETTEKRGWCCACGCARRMSTALKMQMEPRYRIQPLSHDLTMKPITRKVSSNSPCAISPCRH